MDYYKRFDKYFLYSYYDETNKYVGVFKKNTPINIIKDVEHTFSVIEYE